MAENQARTNVVLICTDQWRGDCIGGESPAWTPFLSEMAANGASATNAYAASPTCVPARMSLLTGLKASSHGRLGYIDGVDFDIETTMAGSFSSQGYQTQAIGKMHVSPARMRAGFDNVILHDGYLHHARKGRPDPRFSDDYWAWLRGQSEVGGPLADDYADGAHCNAINARPWDRPEHLHPSNWVTDQAIEWLYRRDPTQPFFLMLSYHRPHAPLNPPRWAWEIYDGKDFPEAPRGNWEAQTVSAYENSDSPTAHVANYPKWVRDRALQGYYGNITHVDAQIGRFMESLADFGLDENTIVCFTSDHGDMMGDHGMWRKGYPYRGSTHIPFFLSGPGVAPGAKISKEVELIDVMPTLLEAAGLEVPPGLDGVSLWPELSGESETATPLAEREYLHGEHYIFGQSLQWIWIDGYCYIWWAKTGQEQLFNEQADPQQLVDLLAEVDAQNLDQDSQKILEKAREALRNQLSGRPEGFVKDGKLTPGAAAALVLPGPDRAAQWA